MLKLRATCEVVLLALCALEGCRSAKPGMRIPTRPFAGSYQVVAHKISNDTSGFKSSGLMWLDAHITPYVSGKKQYVWGAFGSSVDINDDLDVHVHMASWSNHEWKQNAFVMKFPRACSSALRHGTSLMTMIFGEDGKSCPVKAGVRPIVNKTFIVDFPEFRVFPYGRWLFTMVILRNKEIIGFFDADSETVPKDEERRRGRRNSLPLSRPQKQRASW